VPWIDRPRYRTDAAILYNREVPAADDFGQHG
jgi:hypothetical protein